MKFNFIIGNPPYQMPKAKVKGLNSNLYNKIIDKVSNIWLDEIIILCPPGIVIYNKKNYYQLFKNNLKGLKLIDYSVKNYFPKIGTDIILFHCKKNYKNDILVIDNEKNYLANQNYISNIPLFKPSEKNIRFLVHKLKNIKINDPLFFTSRQPKKEGSKYKIIVNKRTNKFKFIDEIPNYFSKKKIAIASTLSFKKDCEFCCIKSNEDFDSYYMITIIENLNKNQINNIYEFLFNSYYFKIIKYLQSIPGEGWLSKIIINTIPSDIINKKYSDKEIQNIFNLTKKEIEMINQ